MISEALPEDNASLFYGEWLRSISFFFFGKLELITWITWSFGLSSPILQPCFPYAGLAFQHGSLPTVSSNGSSLSILCCILDILGLTRWLFQFYAGENTVSTLGRLVLIIWLFVVLIINSSYTASLTSILTVQQLYSPIKGIEYLRSMKEPIGYQQASFARDYLIDELGIDESRLVPLVTPEDYAKALKDGPRKGGVAAVIDERAYVELFLSTSCEFSIVGQEFTRNGWGFVSICFVPFSSVTVIPSVSPSGNLCRFSSFIRLFQGTRLWLLTCRLPFCNFQKMEISRGFTTNGLWGVLVVQQAQS